ncbi:NAD(P)/FAD-dependent oxidoreductase [Coraliomargarita akajimensis]|uniref:FAD dependent oxidoreductase n=1 Tax=Coraliomargarita akajimensis (strain DSM 45221 / IAM 15411 / JCM 23193 / KCTC 12865 / 04OKA010-24) TaxID=583355 RepID=D5EJE3_CORAD|nr:FAD-dependent oxidoreductase [Coraliomargarita akajimensis]ADE54542.1 FAD dependent oxidoreductase [Coraliomargarita akajimensis DSM 45221]
MTAQPQQKRIAVIGCGVAGLTAAWLLSRKHTVHCFEKNNYAGGHTRTLTIPTGSDAGTQVDTGFIVMNHRNYPLFSEVLNQLDVELADSSMSFSYEDRKSGYAYAGNRIRNLCPTIGHWGNLEHLKLLRDLWRFARIGYRDLTEGRLRNESLGAYCQRRGFSTAFLQNYLYPMGAAIWSSPIRQMQDFPAEPYLHFLENHGLLRLSNRPQWRYVKGGSKTYVKALLRSMNASLSLAEAPASIRRIEQGVVLHMPDGQALEYDEVVIGTHADEALNLLEDPTPTESKLLGAWSYQANDVVLHTDIRQLPADRNLWSSWNFARESEHHNTHPVSVSYHMNQLQHLSTRHDYIVTLNPTRPISSSAVINSTQLTHPLYSFESLASQEPLRELNGTRHTWFCGSYMGYGFHEDAVRSAVEIAKKFDIELSGHAQPQSKERAA